jgi:hypothetical protein
LDQLWIGSLAGTVTQVWSGAIDDVRIYNRALSAAEIANLYTQGQVKILAQPSGSSGLSGSLTASWSFDTSSVSGTTVADQSGNGHDLTLVNGASITSGHSGQALTLDGTNQYAYGLISSLPTSVALSMWVKANDVSTTQSILVEEGSGAPSSGYHFTLVGILNGAFYAGFWDIGDIASSPINAGQWYHVILTYDGVAHTQSLYVDGVLQGTQSGVWSPPDDIYFLTGYQQSGCSFTSASGHCSDTAHYFNGQIDDLQGYNQAFTSSDVKSLSTNYVVNIAHSNTAAVSQGLVGYWTMDGSNINWSTGQMQDSSGQGNTGALVGLGTTTAPTMGKIGQALTFDGSTSYITAGDANGANVGLSDFTISAWIKTPAAGSGFPRIVDKDFGTDGYAFYIDPAGSTGVALAGMYQDGGRVSDGAKNVFDNQWHFVAVTAHRNGTADYYIDGGVDGPSYDISSKSGVALSNSSDLIIGRPSPLSGTDAFGGAMDDVRIYNRALSSSEVQQLYNLGR